MAVGIDSFFLFSSLVCLSNQLANSRPISIESFKKSKPREANWLVAMEQDNNFESNKLAFY